MQGARYLSSCTFTFDSLHRHHPQFSTLALVPCNLHFSEASTTKCVFARLSDCNLDNVYEHKRAHRVRDCGEHVKDVERTELQKLCNAQGIGTVSAGNDINYSRRAFVGSALSLSFVLAQNLQASAAVSRKVRLKDVENPKLQEALRAAVAGDLEKAEVMFSELIVEEPKSASVWSNRGSVRVSLQKFEQAAEDFSKAIALAPEAPVPFLNRAISYEALGRYNDAIVDCKTAIENDPELVIAMHVGGNGLLQHEQQSLGYKHAVTLLARFHSHEYAAWFNLGNIEVRVQDYDTALSAYSRASALAPGIAGYRLRQALVLFQLDRLEEARKLIQGLVRKYPNYTEAHAALAAVLWKEGNRSLAEEQFSEATSREPKFSDIRWVGGELQWPPGAMDAMAKFLNITY